MEFLRITSKENDIIKRISQLQKSSSTRKKEGFFVLEGLRLSLDAVLNGFKTEMLVVSDSAYTKYEKDISSLAEGSASCYKIPDSLFEKISDTVNPQGVICVCSFKSVSKKIGSAKGRYIALENLQDPSNLGVIARTAEAFDLDGVIVSGGVDPFSPKSLRASMGALLRIPVYQSENLFDFIEENGLKSYAAVVHGAVAEAGKITFDDGSVVIIGNEANGLTEETCRRSDLLITIPMQGRAESLNAGVAASILMWEMSKC